MINRRIDLSQTGKLWVLLAGLIVALYILTQLGSSIATGSPKFFLLIVAVFVALFLAARIANEWRSGVSLFFVWLVFEDFVRKYLGNNMYIYFAKDVLIAVTYLSLFVTAPLEDRKFFRPPFRQALGLFVLFGFAQVFNPNSPSIFYGVLGIKLYFSYIPLMFVGYAMLRKVNDLRRFLVLSMVVAAVVSMVGILQSIFGLSFLNPHGAAEIDELSHLTRYSPSGLAVMRPPGVFVSDGRFGAYMVLTFILGVGAAGFLLLRPHRTRIFVFPALGLVGLAAALTGSRGAFLYSLIGALLLTAGFMWGAPRGMGGTYRLFKAIRRVFMSVAVAMVLAIVIFPDVFAAHIAFYRETLNPGGENFEAGDRIWDYPIAQLQNALSDPEWVMGHGIGTGSLGTQYVAKILGAPKGIDLGENGYGGLIQEMGILAPILWLAWTVSLLVSAGLVTLRLKGTWAFPLALSITWYAFVLLFAWTWGGLVQYQNFISNAYFWLLVGFLFRLPSLVKEDAQQLQAAAARAG